MHSKAPSAEFRDPYTDHWNLDTPLPQASSFQKLLRKIGYATFPLDRHHSRRTSLERALAVAEIWEEEQPHANLQIEDPPSRCCISRCCSAFFSLFCCCRPKQPDPQPIPRYYQVDWDDAASEL